MTASVIVASIILYLIVAAVVREQIDQRLDTQIEGLRSALALNSSGAVVLTASLDGPPFDRQGSGWYWQVSGDGVRITSRSLASAEIDSPPPPFDWRKALSGEPQRVDGAKRNGEQLYSRVSSATVGTKALQITAAAPVAALSAPARRALLWLIPAMTLLGGSLVGGILLQVRYGLRPIRQLTSDISSIRSGAMARLPTIEVEELRPAAEEINRLVDQNEKRLADTRLHFANLAHGLKTPISSLSLALNSNNDPNHELRDLVDKIDQRIRHHLARARNTVAGKVGISTSLSSCVDDLLLVASRIHVERGIKASCTIDSEIRVRCDPKDLEEILGNLIDNAFKWATGMIAIAAETFGTDVVITILDDGPGIQSATIANAFLPGTRLDETVPGDGFGLTIAKELAELHGGKLSLENARDGGLMCSLTLPLATGLR